MKANLQRRVRVWQDGDGVMTEPERNQNFGEKFNGDSDADLVKRQFDWGRLSPFL